MAFENFNYDEDGGSDAEQEEEFQHSKESTLFVIEATSTMLEPMLTPSEPPSATGQPSASGMTQTAPSSSAASNVLQDLGGWKLPPTSKMEAALRAAYAMMKRKVIAAPKDSIGVLIFNTSESVGAGDTDLTNCYYFVDLGVPTAEGIRTFKEFLQECEDNPEHLATKFAPNKGKHVIADAFSAANRIFRARAPAMSQKRIFFVTDNDNPVDGDFQLQSVAENKRKDLRDMNFDLEPFLIPPRPGEQFDTSLFYDQVINGALDDDGDVVLARPLVATQDLLATMNAMVGAMRSKTAVKRTAFSIAFTLGEAFTIGVNGYQLVGEEKRKKSVKVDLNTAAGEEVISRTVYQDAGTLDPLDPKKDIKKYFQVGTSRLEDNVEASKIFFDEADIRKIKTLGRPPGCTLLGFKPREGWLRFQETIKHSYFLQPNEDMYSGSTRTFASLLKSMVKQDVVGYAVLIARATAKPQIVTLIPQEEKLNDYGIVEAPGGIYVCQLPFKDDLRPLGDVKTASVISVDRLDADGEIDEEAVNTARKIVKSLTKKYNPDFYPNPTLNHFHETLAAIVLDEDLPDPVDKTLPNNHAINARVGKYVVALKSVIPESAIDASEVILSKKRRAVDTPSATPGDPEAIREWIASWKIKGKKLLVKDLKDGLKLLGKPSNGNKPDLLERVEQAIQERGGDNNGDADSEDEAPRAKKTKVSSKKVLSKKKRPADSDDEPATEEEEEEKAVVEKKVKKRKGKEERKTVVSDFEDSAGEE